MTTAVDVVERWRSVAAATGPADRAVAEEGVRLAYRLAGLPEPERIVWAGSPRSGAAAVLRLGGGAGFSVLDEIRTGPWAAARKRLLAELGPGGWAERWAQTGGLLWDTTALLIERIRRGVAEGLAADADGSAGTAAGDAEAQVRLVLLDAVPGQHDAPWLAAFDGDAPELTGLMAVAGSAGWWWPFERVAVVCERPSALHRDEAGRLDCADGPAVSFPDGFALHSWRGMPVPAEFLAGLQRLTPERIRTEENAELRRVMLEHYGYGRYLEAEGAQPVHRDETGVLWRIELGADEPVVMVEVVNSTPEPDGSSRTYWLRVPPRTRTAREGVAWTFDLPADGYEPSKQT